MVGASYVRLSFQVSNLGVLTFDKNLKGQDPEQVQGVGMPVFYVNSNISPKNDDGKEADYIVENFCAWKEVTI